MPGEVLGYLMDIIEATRNESNFVRGVSTRGAQALYRQHRLPQLLPEGIM